MEKAKFVATIDWPAGRRYHLWPHHWNRYSWAVWENQLAGRRLEFHPSKNPVSTLFRAWKVRCHVFLAVNHNKCSIDIYFLTFFQDATQSTEYLLHTFWSHSIPDEQFFSFEPVTPDRLRYFYIFVFANLYLVIQLNW